LARDIDANPAIEVSRAFIPPCTRTISPAERQLSDQTPGQQAGTLAATLGNTVAISVPGEFA